ncbi:MAG: hypothetical protein ABJK39_09995 [Hyphomicrobiales bacterium]
MKLPFVLGADDQIASTSNQRDKAALQSRLIANRVSHAHLPKGADNDH